MRKLILLAGAATMAAWMPALADAKGNPSHANHGQQGKANAGNRYGKGCPPGLARKNVGCLPPGQAKRLFAQGARVPAGYRYSPYSAIPQQYRARVPYADNYNYIYRDNSVYVVDRRTRLVNSIIDLLR